MVRDGFINLLKPPGMTSHDMVAWVRARLGIKRAGHLGTLDPAAAGVLPISLGRATRLFAFAGGPDKAYRAEVVFGISTDSLDTGGRMLEVSDASALTEGSVRALLQRSVGEIEQRPPAFSAAHLGGKRLHELARRGSPASGGQAQSGRPKRVKIIDLELLDFAPGPTARALIDVVCETGTYVRVLAAELGRAAGCGAYLGFLVRTRAGPFELSQAHTREEFEAACEQAEEGRLILPMDWPLARFPAVELSKPAARAFAQGSHVLAAASPGWPVRVYGPDGLFLGLGEVLAERQLRPRVVLAGLPAGRRAR